MSLALKCDFCKEFFAFEDETVPNIISFGQIYECVDHIKLNSHYNTAPNIIKKNVYNVDAGVYTFIICNKCMKRIMNLIINEEENDDNA